MRKRSDRMILKNGIIFSDKISAKHYSILLRKKIYDFMKRIVLLSLSVLLFGFVHAQTSDATTQPQQDINKLAEFKNADYDFGKIPYGKPVEFIVSIKNISNDALTLDNVTVGCGCTTPKYEKGKKFLPGETIIVTLGFNAGTMGTFLKNATLYFNNGTLNKQVNFKGETYQTPANAAPANGTIEKIKPNNN